MSQTVLPKSSKRADVIAFFHALGAGLVQSKKNDKLHYNGKTTIVPNHREVDHRLLAKMMRDLGIKNSPEGANG